MLRSLKRFVRTNETSTQRKRRSRIQLKLEQLESRQLLAADIATMHLGVAEGEPAASITYSYEVTDAMGDSISSIDVGQTFSIKVFVRDSRAEGCRSRFVFYASIGWHL